MGGARRPIILASSVNNGKRRSSADCFGIDGGTVVGTVAYYAVNSGHADLWVNALVGYGILQALVLLRLIPRLLKAPFSASYWAYTFGVAALSTAPLRMIAQGQTGPATEVAPALFVVANVVTGLIVVCTIRLLIQGRLLPAPVSAR